MHDGVSLQRRSLGVAKDQKAALFSDQILSERDDRVALEINYPKIMMRETQYSEVGVPSEAPNRPTAVVETD